jgi:hypothetical protein
LAQTLHEEALEIFAGIGSQFNLFFIWMGLGWIATLGGNVGAVRTYLTDAAQGLAGVSERRFLIYCTIGLVSVALCQGQPHQAARLLGVIDTLRTSTHTRLLPLVAAIAEENTARAKAALAPSEFAADWEAGRQMSLAQALAHDERHERTKESLNKDAGEG